MLTPSYLLHATEPAEEIAEELHQDILNRIVQRVKARMEHGDDYILTATDKWNIETLQQAGYLLEDIQRDIAKATGKLVSEIAEAMEDAGVTALEYDDKIYRDAGLDPKPLTQSPNLIQIMQRDYEATMGEWTNFTQTTANAAYKKFIELCDRAYHQAIAGAISPSQAVKEALGDLINSGLDVIVYRDDQGRVTRRETIETAVTRAVRTGISQAAADIQIARMDEFGVDLVLVSSHLGARPSHQEWQGKIYSRTGTDYPDFIDSTGYGSVTGLCGANCRHSFGPYFGQRNPYEQFDSEENKERYELEQRQRELERRIRDTKRQVMGYQAAGDEENCGRKAVLLQKQNAAYNQFCEENDLKKRSERISIARWDRSQAAKARAAAKKRIEEVGESAATQNWHSISVAGGKTDTKYRMITEPKTTDENLALVNPSYRSKKPEYRQNCQRCVPAYEMRRRGYDVIAKPAKVTENGVLSPSDELYTKWNQVFKGARFSHCMGADGGKAEIVRRMGEWDDGAVAEVMVQWKDSGAHAFVAEKVGGNIRFIDPQTGKTDCENYFTNAKTNATMIARIDNLEPTELIEKCIKNRGGKQ